MTDELYSGSSNKTQEVAFSQKVLKPVLPALILSNNNVSQASSQKHLGVMLDKRLTFAEHFKTVLGKINKSTHSLLPGSAYYIVF